MRTTFLLTEPVDELAELDRRFAVIASLGYEGVELTGRWPMPYPAAEVQALAARHALPVVSLLSGWSYSHEGLCLASRDLAVRDGAARRLGDYLGYAAALPAIVVVGLMQGLPRDEPDAALARERITEGLASAARRASAAGTELILEPVNHLQVGFHHTAGEVAALVDRIDSPAMGYMLDTIHMNIEERSPLDTIRLHGPRVRHFHLCETNAGPFGTGHLDFPAVLGALRDAGYAHYASVKIYRGASWEEAARSAAAFLELHSRQGR